MSPGHNDCCSNRGAGFVRRGNEDERGRGSRGLREERFLPQIQKYASKLLTVCASERRLGDCLRQRLRNEPAVKMREKGADD